MCPPDYHHSSFVTNQALGDMIFGYMIFGINERKSAQQAPKGG